MTTKFILVVEDSAADVDLIQRAVKACGQDLQLWSMADGAEALQFLRTAHPLTSVPPPALILIDLLLPKMSGTQLLTEIRQLPAYQATPIIILSQMDKEREEAVCLQLGATAFVQKSLNFHSFMNSIKALIEHWVRSESEREEEQSWRDSAHQPLVSGDDSAA